MEIQQVIDDLERLRTTLNIKAFDSGDYDEELMYSNQAELMAEAVEYLWQYQDLMH